MIIEFIKNNFKYTIMTSRVPSSILNKYIKDQIDYITFIHKKFFLTINESTHGVNILKDYKKHCIHATLQVTKQNLTTGEIQNFNFPITSSPKPVIIIPSLSESLLGEMPKTYNVIKIKDGLYITSHSICNAWDLKSEPLRYDEDVGGYVEVAINKPFNITKKDMENMSVVVVNNIESSEGIKNVDITLMGDLKNDIVSYKMLGLIKKGEFDKETYQEISHKMDLVDDKFNELEKEYGMFNKLLEPTSFDE